MSISPTVAIWLSIAYTILAGLTPAMLSAMGFDNNTSVILAWAAFVGLILSTVLHAFSSTAPGPLSKDKS